MSYIRRVIRVTPSVLAAAALAVSHEKAAYAETQSTATDFPHFKTVLGGELGFWNTRFGTTLPFVPFVEAKVAPKISLGFRLPLGFASGQGGFASPGNPGFSLHGLIVDDERTRFYLGFQTAFPLLRIAEDRDLTDVTSRAGAATAFMTLPDWNAQHLALGLLAGLEHKLDAPIFLRFQLDPFALVPLGNGANGGFHLRTRFELEARGESGFGGGFNVGGSLVASNNSSFQSSTSGFFSYWHRTVFLRAGLLLALDNPLGFGFDEGKVATVYFNLGVPLN